MNQQQFSQPIALKDMDINDPFWSVLMEKVRTKVIPYQWDALNDQIPDAAPSHCMANFRIAAGMEEGEFAGCVFQDSDFAKWIEAVGYSLSIHPDPELEALADGAIDIVVAAQQPDGYWDTYYIINGLDKRWTNLRDNHELYCAGHMIEGAIAYYQGTGKRKLLDAAIRMADCIDNTFGLEPGKMQGYPGHEVIEMALVRLYHVTKEERYLKLAKYFIDQRGQQPLYFVEEEKKNGKPSYWARSYFQYQYYQAGLPVREQTEAQGHSVRAVYLYSGMADVARETGDDTLMEACRTLWNNMTRKRMYITGGIGSSDYGEAFTFDYDLPNDTVYAETCASIGLIFFARRMLEMEIKGDYADVMERALYNGVISGMSLSGTEFFYVNPLEVLPEASEKDQLRRHVLPTRPKWFGCACCPPNLARLLSSIGAYAATTREDALYMHLYLGGEMRARLSGVDVTLTTTTNYPWQGDIRIQVQPEKAAQFALGLRIPGWCTQHTLRINGEEITIAPEDGYIVLDRYWEPGAVIELQLDMPVQVIAANPNVRQNIGKVAVTRGPIVYCMEQADNGPGLQRIYLSSQPDFEVEQRDDLLDGVTIIKAHGRRQRTANWSENLLYAPDVGYSFEDVRLTFIPYYAWANRGAGEMTVWVRG